MTAVTYLQRIQELLAELTDRRDQIEHAAGVCTDCIAAENVVHVFVGSPPPINLLAKRGAVAVVFARPLSGM
jgi:hypothetical protein